jgi:CHAT domain-containing protein
MATSLNLDDQTLKKFGTNLFEALFQPDIRDQFYRSLGIAFSQKKNLRIKLRIDAPDLAHYPWEYMYDGKQTHKFLARNKDVSITRFLKIAEPVRQISLKPPIKIMVVISNPYKDIKVEKEQNLIKDALAKLKKRGLVKLNFMKKATLKEFSHVVKKTKIDVVHFIGHGEYSEGLGGCLAFESENGDAELVNVDKIGTILEEKYLRLVVLNACQTGEISKSEISLGVAEGLIKIGIPAVIAMQFKIPDDSAIEFSKDFYTTLAETFQVDRAVTEARRNLFINLSGGRIDWGIPVLFMRKDDGVIF